MAMLEVKDLEVYYGMIQAIKGISFEVNQGEVVALIGANGAGKTTTIKMLSTLTLPTKGDAVVSGESIISSPNLVKERIVVSPQETAVAPSLSVKENLTLMCDVHGLKKDKAKEKIEELSKALDLESVMNRKAGKLSGGWQRRLSIAMALVSEPKVLFLDEPTLGLDVIARSELWDLIESLKGKTTIVLTTHYMEEAEALSDRLGVMKNGRLLFTGTVKEMKEKTGAERIEDAFIKMIKEAK